MRLFCNMDLYRFPFDTQKCRVLFESWSYTTEHLLLVWDEVNALVMNDRFTLAGYTMISAKVNSSFTNYTGGAHQMDGGFKQGK